MNRLRSSLWIGLLFASGCSAVDAHVDHDPEVDFEQLSTFAWRPSNVPERTDPNPMQAEIRATVAAVLKSKGYRQVEDNPDFQVAVFGGSKRLQTSMSLGYLRWEPGQPRDMYTYEEESLVIDIIDPAENHLIWQGQAKGALGTQPTPGQRADMIETAARTLLAQFPPK